MACLELVSNFCHDEGGVVSSGLDVVVRHHMNDSSDDRTLSFKIGLYSPFTTDDLFSYIVKVISRTSVGR